MVVSQPPPPHPPPARLLDHSSWMLIAALIVSLAGAPVAVRAVPRAVLPPGLGALSPDATAGMAGGAGGAELAAIAENDGGTLNRDIPDGAQSENAGGTAGTIREALGSGVAEEELTTARPGGLRTGVSRCSSPQVCLQFELCPTAEVDVLFQCAAGRVCCIPAAAPTPSTTARPPPQHSSTQRPGQQQPQPSHPEDLQPGPLRPRPPSHQPHQPPLHPQQQVHPQNQPQQQLQPQQPVRPQILPQQPLHLQQPSQPQQPVRPQPQQPVRPQPPQPIRPQPQQPVRPQTQPSARPQSQSQPPSGMHPDPHQQGQRPQQTSPPRPATPPPVDRQGATPTPTGVPTGVPTPSTDASALLPSTEVCGKFFTENRITNGKIADLGQFPWMALLGYNRRRNSNVSFLCGGTLINKRYILTAAHCFSASNRPVVVRLGEFNLTAPVDCDHNKVCAAAPLDIGVEAIIPHPEFDFRTIKHDIALLRLASPIPEYTDWVRPICLPTGGVNVTDDTKFKIAGWGKTDFRDAGGSPVLQYTDVSGVAHDECNELQPPELRPLDEGQLCAGGDKGKDACKGDSGGPLMVTLPVPNTITFQIGVVSYGPDSPCGTAPLPSIYTRVAAYLPWILATIRP